MSNWQAFESFTNQALKGLSRHYHVELLHKYQAVTKDDVISALRTYILPLFDPASSIAVIVTTPSKADQIEEGLKGAGFEVERRTMEGSENDGSSLSSGESGSER